MLSDGNLCDVPVYEGTAQCSTMVVVDITSSCNVVGQYET